MSGFAPCYSVTIRLLEIWPHHGYANVPMFLLHGPRACIKDLVIYIEATIGCNAHRHVMYIIAEDHGSLHSTVIDFFSACRMWLRLV
jgi:hypothetical protein